MTCPYCNLFKAQGLPCEVCTASEPLTPRKMLTRNPARQKAGSSWLTELHKAGMQTDSQIAEGLATGAVVQAIGWQANYLHVIDYLVSRGYSVQGYRARVVCGSEYLTKWK